MLNVYKSNRMETLMDALVSVIGTPLDDPILPEWIGVQSRGMKQWISTTLADRFSISANIHFIFLKDIIEKALDSNRSFLKTGKAFSEPVILCALMDFFSKPPQSSFYQGILQYVSQDVTGIKLFQICDRISRLFDDYQIYRPDMLASWQSPEWTAPLQGSNAAAISWQSALFRELSTQGFEQHLGHRIQSFLGQSSPHRDLFFTRICLFGISSMPPIFMSVFDELARHGDVNLFLLTPSREFFGYIKSPREQSYINGDIEEQYYESGNPLLASLGKPGREFHLLLESFDYHEPVPELFETPDKNSSSMLSVVQSDILNLIHRKPDGDTPPLKLPASDRSIDIHACHTPMREVQVLKDQLLSLFEKDPDLFPHDIIVMMPDIESYSPYIDAVFSVETLIPYAISDRVQKSEFELVEAVLKIFELFRSRFELHNVLDLLHCDAIAGQFEILPEEIGILEKISMDAGILWGIDAGQRKALNLPAEHENTWEFGLQRLMLGLAMPVDSDDMINGMLACPSLEGLEADLLGRFAHFCETLFSQQKALDGKNNIPKWGDILCTLVSVMTRQNFENESQYLFVIQALEAVKENALNAGCQVEVGFDVMKLMEEKELSKSISTASFMAGKMTFCNILPMRSVPFKVVALMGMNEADFPRKGIRDSFDLMKNTPLPCDKIERDEDRYLFLEALLSARKRFLVTYTGMNIRDNTPIPASTVITELLDVLQDSFSFERPDTLVSFHPLHGFSERYFQEFNSTGLFSYSKIYGQMAQRLTSPLKPARSFFNNIPCEAVPGSAAAADPETVLHASESIDIQDLVLFFSAPLPYFMKNHLGILFDREESPFEDREPDSLNGLSKYELGTLLLDRFLQRTETGSMDAKNEYERIRAMGKLPHGQKGVLEYHDVKTLTDQISAHALPILQKTLLPPLRIDVQVHHFRITGVIPNLTEEEAFWVAYGRLAPKRKLTYWIYHLLLNSMDDSKLPDQSIIIGQSESKPMTASKLVYPGIRNQAKEYLTQLVSIFKKGRISPFIFFPETSWQFTKEFLKTDPSFTDANLMKAFGAASRKWFDEHRNTGDKTDRYVGLFFKEKDLFEDLATFMNSGLHLNSIEIFKPLMKNMRVS